MALTLTTKRRGVRGDQDYVELEVDFDASYPTGGESLTRGDIGFRRIDSVEARGRAGYTFEYDYANSKLLAYHGNNDGVADGPSVQVPDTTDLSAVTDVRVVVYGLRKN